MISPHPLDRLVARDTFREIVDLLEPEELVVAALRLEGLSDAQIAGLLDISRSAVCLRMRQARERIVEQLPEVAPLIRDRRQPRQKPLSNETLPLEHGWLCRPTGHEDGRPPQMGADLTTHDVARRYRVSTQTVTRWLRAGCFPNAYRVDDHASTYRIPECDLAGFRPEQW